MQILLAKSNQTKAAFDCTVTVCAGTRLHSSFPTPTAPNIRLPQDLLLHEVQREVIKQAAARQELGASVTVGSGSDYKGRGKKEEGKRLTVGPAFSVKKERATMPFCPLSLSKIIKIIGAVC